MRLASSDREVIKALFQGKGWIDSYLLHERFRLSPGQIIDILDRLIRAGYARLDGTMCCLTAEGRAWVIAARRSIFMDVDRRRWQPGPDLLVASVLDPAEPYIPDIDLVDLHFFQLLGVQRGAEPAKG